MKVQIRNPTNGGESLYDFKSDILFSLHIKNLFENLIVFNNGLKRILSTIPQSKDELYTHYSLQEATSGSWLETSNDPLINSDSTLFLKVRPLNHYIQPLEKMLQSVKIISTPTSTNNQESTAFNSQLINGILNLQTHLALLMYEGSKKSSLLLLSSDVIRRIINIVFLAPSTHSLQLLVFLVSTSLSSDDSNSSLSLPISTFSNNNNTLPSKEKEGKKDKTKEKEKEKESSSQPKQPKESNTTTTTTTTSSSSTTATASSPQSLPNKVLPSTNYKPYSINHQHSSSSSSSSSSCNNNNNNNSSNNSVESPSLFTLIDHSIKSLSNEYSNNFYLYILNYPYEKSEIKFNVVCLVLTAINNMYRLSPNPVNYLNRLHTESVFKFILEYAKLTSNIYHNTQYIILRNNLMKELHLQRLHPINIDKVLSHQILLSDLWSSALSSMPFGGISSENWLLLGFRSPNPMEDFKNTGVLALRNLSYFSKQHTQPFQSLLLTQTKREELLLLKSENNNDTDIVTITTKNDECENKDNNNNNNNNNDHQEEGIELTNTNKIITKPRSNSRSYPLATVAISLTYTLSNIFRIGRENVDGNLWDIAFSGSNWFDEIFVTTFNLFESLWHSEAHSYSDFPHVITHTRMIVEKVCSKQPIDIQDFKDKLQTILEKKESIDMDISIETLARYHQLQPSHINKRHIHKIFGERVNIETLPNSNVDQQQQQQQQQKDGSSLTTNTEISNINNSIDANDKVQKEFDSNNSNNNNNNNSSNNKSSSSDECDSNDSFLLSSNTKEFNGKNLIKFFGERIIDSKEQYAPQPSNVKSYKLKNFFGEQPTVILNESLSTNNDSNININNNENNNNNNGDNFLNECETINNNSNNNNNQEEEEEEEEEENVRQFGSSPRSERNHRLHVFFGEWFDTEQVEYNEKLIRTSTTPETSSPPFNSQPENARLHKLNKFFGERVNIPISKQRVIGEGGGGGIFPIDDVSESEFDLNNTAGGAATTSNSNFDNLLSRSPEETRSDFKAQKVLGERLDIKKEKESINFAPQPAHIREYKLHKLFGEMVPAGKPKSPIHGSANGGRGGPWKKGNVSRLEIQPFTLLSPGNKGSGSSSQNNSTCPTPINSPTSDSNEVLTLEDAFANTSNLPVIIDDLDDGKGILIPSLSPRPFSDGGDQELVEDELNSDTKSEPIISKTCTDIAQIDQIHQQQQPNSLDNSNIISPRKTTTVINNDENIIIDQSASSSSSSPVVNNKDESYLSTETNQPSSIREALSNESLNNNNNSGKVTTTTTTTTNNNNNNNIPNSISTYSINSEEDEEEIRLREEYKIKHKNHRLHVFFGERFDVENTHFYSRVSAPGSYDPKNDSSSPLLHQVSPQPETVKSYKLKKFFGKNPEDEPLSSSFDSNMISTIPKGVTSGNALLFENHRLNSSSPSTPQQSHTPVSGSPSSSFRNSQKHQFQFISAEDPEGDVSKSNEIRKLRRDFKTQKILGERLNIKKESTSVSFQDQPSTIKVDKLISLFGEKVGFSLKRKETPPSLQYQLSSSSLKYSLSSTNLKANNNHSKNQ